MNKEQLGNSYEEWLENKQGLIDAAGGRTCYEEKKLFARLGIEALRADTRNKKLLYEILDEYDTEIQDAIDRFHDIIT